MTCEGIDSQKRKEGRKCEAGSVETTVVKVKGGDWICPAGIIDHLHPHHCWTSCEIKGDRRLSKEQHANMVERECVYVLVTRSIFTLNTDDLESAQSLDQESSHDSYHSTD